MSSVKQNQKSKNKEKTTKWSSTREISSVPNWLKETKNLLFFTRRLRFKRVRLRREKSITSRDLMISWPSENTSLILRDNSMFLRMKLLAFRISKEKSICFKKNILSNNKKLSTSAMSSRSHSTFTDGESWNALIQRPTRWFKKFSLFKKDSSRRQRKSQRRMFSSKRKRSSTSSLKTFWLNKVAQKLRRNFKFTNKT